MNIREAIEEFLTASDADGVKKTTLNWYASCLKQMSDRIGDMETAQVRTRDLRQIAIDIRNTKERYRDASQRPTIKGGLAEASIGSYMRAMHRFWNWASKEYGIQNPMERIKRPPMYKTPPKALEIEDWVRMVRSLENTVEGYRDHAILAFLLDTGCRANGLITLSNSALSLRNRSAIVTEKGNKTRTVYFTSYTAKTLEIWREYRPDILSDHVFCSLANNARGKPLSYEGLYHIMKRIGKRAGVQGHVNPHAFRHAFAKNFLMAGGDLASASKLMGHSSVTVTSDFYARFTDKELAEKHDRHSPLRRFDTTDNS